MSMHIEDLSRRAQLSGHADVARELRSNAAVLRERGGPKFFGDRQHPFEPEVDLRKWTVFITDKTRRPTEQEARKLGWFERAVDIKPLSVGQVVMEHPDHFWDGQMDYLDQHLDLRDLVSPAMVVVVGTGRVDSTEVSSLPDYHLVEADMFSERWVKAKFPDAQAIVLSLSGYAQADIALAKQTGFKLLPNYCSRVLDAAGVYIGRRSPDSKLIIGNKENGLSGVAAGVSPAIVFLNDLSSIND